MAALARMQRLPLEHLLPRLLVVRIVYLDDVLHVLGRNVLVLPAPALAQHRVPEHLLAGIHPELAAAVLGDLRYGGGLTFGGQRERLIGRRSLIGSGHLEYERAKGKERTRRNIFF